MASFKTLEKCSSVQDQDQTRGSKLITSGRFPIIYSRKLVLYIHWHGKCCFRPKMHKIKVRDGGN